MPDREAEIRERSTIKRTPECVVTWHSYIEDIQHLLSLLDTTRTALAEARKERDKYLAMLRKYGRSNTNSILETESRLIQLTEALESAKVLLRTERTMVLMGSLEAQGTRSSHIATVLSKIDTALGHHA